jgi:hypothetical protein
MVYVNKSENIFLKDRIDNLEQDKEEMTEQF